MLIIGEVIFHRNYFVKMKPSALGSFKLCHQTCLMYFGIVRPVFELFLFYSLGNFLLIILSERMEKFLRAICVRN